MLDYRFLPFFRGPEPHEASTEQSGTLVSGALPCAGPCIGNAHRPPATLGVGCWSTFLAISRVWPSARGCLLGCELQPDPAWKWRGHGSRPAHPPHGALGAARLRREPRGSRLLCTFSCPGPSNVLVGEVAIMFRGQGTAFAASVDRRFPLRLRNETQPYGLSLRVLPCPRGSGDQAVLDVLDDCGPDSLIKV